jgi:hypothetical protein
MRQTTIQERKLIHQVLNKGGTSMKKKQKQPKRPLSKKNEDVTLKDTLQSDVFQALKAKKKELEKEETVRKEEEAERKREEARQREKNKSFEELLGESSMNWKDFK